MRGEHSGSDVWKQIEVQIVFVRSALAFADLLFGLNELYSFNPLHHLVTQLILHSQPQRRAILFPERRAVHLISKQALRLQNVIQALRTVIRPAVQAWAK